MFGAKKLATNHLAPWNEPPKLPIPKGLEQFHDGSVPHKEFIDAKNFKFCFHIGENMIPKY
jgi:hypothetical protein